MIDSILIRRAYKNPRPVDITYKPEDSIVSKKFIDSKNHKLAVIFPGWHTHNFPVNILAKRLAKRGWSVLYYDFHDQILEPNDWTVKRSFDYIRDQITSDIESIVHQRAYRQIHFIGISLGSVPLGMVADKFKKFSSVTWVVGGEDLAIDMWHGLRTQDLRRDFEQVRIGLKKLAKDWDNLGPDHHLKCFKNKSVRLVVSKTDIVILAKYQYKLAEELNKIGAQTKINKRYTGHFMTILRYCLFSRLP